MRTSNKSQITVYTHNHFKTYEKCKRKYYYEYVKNLHWPSLDSNFELGLSIHKLLDYQAKGLEVEAIVKDAKPEIQEYWQYLKSSDILNYKIVASEWAFTVCLEKGKSWLEGRVDRIIEEPASNKTVILDFKTGQKIPKPQTVDWQMAVYLYAISESRNISPSQLAFWYYKVANQLEFFKQDYSPKLHKSYCAEFINMIEKISNTTSWNVDSECNRRFCQYEKLCNNSVM